MNPHDQMRLHEDAELFRAAVNFTAAETAFPARLVEKDYFSSVLLGYLAESGGKWVFKGGTCLAKVHAGFYRMSEDMDFSISMPVNAQRSTRSREATGIKKSIDSLSRNCSCFSVLEPVRGANKSTQYVGVVGYSSLVSGKPEKIKIELGLREPLLTGPEKLQASTVLLNPISGKAMLASIEVLCLSKMESFAEKFRAALTRREIAIRDFFDLDYAHQNLNLRTQDKMFVDLVKKKLAMPGNEPVDVSPGRIESLRAQLDTQLKPVLRTTEFREFDLDRAVKLVTEMAERIGTT